jgi:hypothetical protein
LHGKVDPSVLHAGVNEAAVSDLIRDQLVVPHLPEDIESLVYLIALAESLDKDAVSDGGGLDSRG